MRPTNTWKLQAIDPFQVVFHFLPLENFAILKKEAGSASLAIIFQGRTGKLQGGCKDEKFQRLFGEFIARNQTNLSPETIWPIFSWKNSGVVLFSSWRVQDFPNPFRISSNPWRISPKKFTTSSPSWFHGSGGGGGELVAFFVSLLQDVSFAGFYRKTLSQSCLLMQARCDSILSKFPAFNQPFRFRLVPTVLVSHCYHHFLPSISTKGDDWERLAVQKKNTCECAFRLRKAGGSNFFAVGVCERFIAMGEAKTLRSCVVWIFFSKKGHEGVDSTSRSYDKWLVGWTPSC